MDVSKRIPQVLLRIGVLVGALVAITLVINLSWFDENLNPEVARLLPPEPVSMEGNAFPLIYGFLAANDRDARTAGLEIVRQLREQVAAGRRATLTAEAIDDILGHPDPAEPWNELFASELCNSRFELECADRLIAEVRDAGIGDPRLGVLLERFEAVLAASRFEENQEYDAYTPTPPYGVLLRIARVRLAKSANERPVAGFIEDIGQDIRFWKTMLRDGQTLIAKMVALAGLRNDTQFLSALMRARQLSPTEIEAIERALTPLSDAERDIGETFLAEFRLAASSDKSFAVLLEGPSALTGLALQQNATLNEFYLTTTLPLRFRAAQSANEFYEQRGYERLGYELRAFPPPLYNLGGKLVLKWFAAQIGMVDYISRVHDIDGRIALVLLQAEILSSPGRRVESVIARSEHRNPYTLAPMDYDPETGRIGFDCLGNGADVCAVALDDRGL